MRIVMAFVLRNSPKDLFKHMKCAKNGGHTYEQYNEFMIQGGMGKVKEYRCSKCGHDKARVI